MRRAKIVTTSKKSWPSLAFWPRLLGSCHDLVFQRPPWEVAMSGTAAAGLRHHRTPGWRPRGSGLRCVIALLLATGLTSCGIDAAPAPTARATTRPVASLTDVVWAQLTVAMDERATQVLDLVPE